MSATDCTKVILPGTAFDVLLHWSYWQMFFLLRHCTAVRLSQVYWLYVTQVTLRCTSARTFVDLRRCGVVFLGNAFSALVSDTEMAAFITQLQWIPHHQGHPASTDFIFYCETAIAWVAYCCAKKKRYLCKRAWCNKCNYLCSTTHRFHIAAVRVRHWIRSWS